MLAVLIAICALVSMSGLDGDLRASIPCWSPTTQDPVIPEDADFSEVEDLEESEEMADSVEELDEEYETIELLPVWFAPDTYRVELHISWGNHSVSVARFVSGKRIRSEVLDQERETIWLETGVLRDGILLLSESEQLALEYPLDPSISAFDTREMGIGLDGYLPEYIGEERTLGKPSLKYRVAQPGGVVLAWYDARSGAPLRMETEWNGVPYSIEWRSYGTERQHEALFQVPENYATKEASRPGSASSSASQPIVGRLTEGEAAILDGEPIEADWGTIFHAGADDSETMTPVPFGGTLGIVAGAYIPGWVGALLAGHTRHGRTGGDIQR